jgi:hypothetical protein
MHEHMPIASGKWCGFYVYEFPRLDERRHRMDMGLEIRSGKIYGEGVDDVGRYTIDGTYDEETLDFSWRKAYLGRHVVFYQGGWAQGSIVGRWEIRFAWVRSTGGFRIWPEGSAPEDDPEIPRELAGGTI